MGHGWPAWGKGQGPTAAHSRCVSGCDTCQDQAQTAPLGKGVACGREAPSIDISDCGEGAGRGQGIQRDP